MKCDTGLINAVFINHFTCCFKYVMLVSFRHCKNDPCQGPFNPMVWYSHMLWSQSLVLFRYPLGISFLSLFFQQLSSKFVDSNYAPGAPYFIYYILCFLLIVRLYATNRTSDDLFILKGCSYPKPCIVS